MVSHTVYIYGRLLERKWVVKLKGDFGSTLHDCPWCHGDQRRDSCDSWYQKLKKKVLFFVIPQREKENLSVSKMKKINVTQSSQFEAPFMFAAQVAQELHNTGVYFLCLILRVTLVLCNSDICLASLPPPWQLCTIIFLYKDVCSMLSHGLSFHLRCGSLRKACRRDITSVAHRQWFLRLCDDITVLILSTLPVERLEVPVAIVTGGELSNDRRMNATVDAVSADLFTICVMMVRLLWF